MPEPEPLVTQLQMAAHIGGIPGRWFSPSEVVRAIEAAARCAGCGGTGKRSFTESPNLPALIVACPRCRGSGVIDSRVAAAVAVLKEG